ncbi:MAG: type II secretion system F family protein [Candidatus Omnitrophica bacterium]|nr:type II secretion system F family protein [Candidatus Omnitrophota bacterium]
MSIYSYQLKSTSGKVTKGTLETDTKEKALEFLHSQEGIVLSLKEESSKKLIRKKGKVKTDELVIFSRQLTTLIESGIPVVGAMDILTDQVTNPFFKGVLSTISTDLKSGTAFAPSLAKHPKVFPEIYISMVEAAETSGNLPQILDRLSVYLEKMSTLKKKIVASLIYPSIVLFMTVVMTAFLLLKIVPTFKELYSALGASLPLPTQILMSAADILGKYFFLIIFGVFAAIAAIKKYISTPKGKRQYHALLLKLPVLGDIFKKVGIAKFARTFATLVKSGVPITATLDIVGKTSGNKLIEEAIVEAKQSIQEGVPISKPLEESGLFPPMVVKMIAVGERSGKLEFMLGKIAEFYEEQTDAIISGLASIIEPILIVFLGVVVGSIVIALFLPIIEISEILAKS